MKEYKTWPDGARTAALITINLDGEQFWLGMFPDSVRRPKTLSMGDYGIDRGLDRVLRTLKDREITSTFFVPGMVAENHPEAIEKIMRDGHEIALHGYSHTPMHLLTAGQQEEEMEKGKEALKKVTGSIPEGFRAPEGELTEVTMDLMAKAGFVYSSSLYDNDKPYEYPVKEGRLIEIPMNWDLHDFPYFAFNYGPAFPSGQGRVSSYKRVTENYIEEFDAYHQLGLAYVAQFTPQSIGSPGKIQIMEQVLDHICAQEQVWKGTCRDLVRFQCGR